MAAVEPLPLRRPRGQCAPSLRLVERSQQGAHLSSFKSPVAGRAAFKITRHTTRPALRRKSCTCSICAAIFTL